MPRGRRDPALRPQRDGGAAGGAGGRRGAGGRGRGAPGAGGGGVRGERGRGLGDDLLQGDGGGAGVPGRCRLLLPGGRQAGVGGVSESLGTPGASSYNHQIVYYLPL